MNIFEIVKKELWFLEFILDICYVFNIEFKKYRTLIKQWKVCPPKKLLMAIGLSASIAFEIVN